MGRNLKYARPYMRGEDVNWLQEQLKAHGYEPGSIDGIFGRNTEKAVITFQTAKGLKVDGIAGVKTKAALLSTSVIEQPVNASVSDFLIWLRQQVGYIYVWGAQGEVVPDEDWIRRKGMRISDASSCFSGRIFCGDCGSVYGCKVWHSTSKYRRVVWRCNGKYEKNEKICSTPHFYEEQLKAMFVDVMNIRIRDRSNIISAYTDIIKVLTDNTALKSEAAEL